MARYVKVYKASTTLYRCEYEGFTFFVLTHNKHDAEKDIRVHNLRNTPQFPFQLVSQFTVPVVIQKNGVIQCHPSRTKVYTYHLFSIDDDKNINHDGVPTEELTEEIIAPLFREHELVSPFQCPISILPCQFMKLARVAEVRGLLKGHTFITSRSSLRRIISGGNISTSSIRNYIASHCGVRSNNGEKKLTETEDDGKVNQHTVSCDGKRGNVVTLFSGQSVMIRDGIVMSSDGKHSPILASHKGEDGTEVIVVESEIIPTIPLNLFHRMVSIDDVKLYWLMVKDSIRDANRTYISDLKHVVTGLNATLLMGAERVEASESLPFSIIDHRMRMEEMLSSLSSFTLKM